MKLNQSCNMSFAVFAFYTRTGVAVDLAVLTGAAVPIIVEVDGYRVGKVLVEVAGFFLRESLSCNDCSAVSRVKLAVAIACSPSKACSTLIASLALVSK